MAYLDRSDPTGNQNTVAFLPAVAQPKGVAKPLAVPVSSPQLLLVRRPGLHGLLSAANVQSGYLPANPAFDAVFNRALAAICLVLTAPIFALVWGLLKLDGGPAFYKGARLGKAGEVFDILKFRTLDVGAQQRLATGTLPKRSRLETRLGSHLRKSRIDELPQLINILKGDMVFFGPRPVRPELVPIYRAESEGFEQRFLVQPGLVGMSQALLPHAASKRLRGRFNAMCCAAPVRYGFLLRFVTLVGLRVLGRSAAGMAEAARATLSPIWRYPFLRSGFARPRDVDAVLTTKAGPCAGVVCAMSDEILQLVLTLPVDPGPARLVLSRKLRSGRVITMDLDARIARVDPLGLGRPGFVAYATFAPRSAYQRYRLERYFLDQTVLPS